MDLLVIFLSKIHFSPYCLGKKLDFSYLLPSSIKFGRIYAHGQVTSLVRLQLLTSVGVELLDQPKYKCNVSLDFIRTVAKTVQFDIYKYLYDYC